MNHCSNIPRRYPAHYPDWFLQSPSCRIITPALSAGPERAARIHAAGYSARPVGHTSVVSPHQDRVVRLGQRPDLVRLTTTSRACTSFADRQADGKAFMVSISADHRRGCVMVAAFHRPSSRPGQLEAERPAQNVRAGERDRTVRLALEGCQAVEYRLTCFRESGHGCGLDADRIAFQGRRFSFLRFFAANCKSRTAVTGPHGHAAALRGAARA